MNTIRGLAKLVAFVAPAVTLAVWSGLGRANAPPTRYQVTNGSDAGASSTGAVYDTLTGLTWQQGW
jgi:hypothetical protein